MIHEITDENFESEVMDAGIPCVIEFTSDWCVLCKDMSPHSRRSPKSSVTR